MFQYKLQCDEDFYSMCDQFCHSNDMAYRCDNQGHKICKPGMYIVVIELNTLSYWYFKIDVLVSYSE